MIWLVALPIAMLLLIRWVTRRPSVDDQIQMTDARRAELIQLERGERH